MALIVKSASVDAFLAALKDLFDQDKVATWIRDDDGDFTHVPDQWKNKAWIRTRASSSGLIVFNLLGQKNIAMTKTIYAVYHGRFAEMLLTHLDRKFDSVELTAKKHSGDVFT